MKHIKSFHNPKISDKWGKIKESVNQPNKRTRPTKLVMQIDELESLFDETDESFADMDSYLDRANEELIKSEKKIKSIKKVFDSIKPNLEKTHVDEISKRIKNAEAKLSDYTKRIS